jgi:hypothetical protein
VQKEAAARVTFHTRAWVTEKGCLDRFVAASMACVNLGEALKRETRKRVFYCTRDFPSDCSQIGCPILTSIESEWSEDLRNITQYETEESAANE